MWQLPRISGVIKVVKHMTTASGAAPASGNASKNCESASPAITPVFKTPLPYRDEILSMDGRDFVGTIFVMMLQGWMMV